LLGTRAQSTESHFQTIDLPHQCVQIDALQLLFDAPQLLHDRRQIIAVQLRLLKNVSRHQLLALNLIF
jgi:hypothetical protein